MNRIKNIFILLITTMLLLTALVPAAFAKGPEPTTCDTWHLCVIHGKNGERLGLERELPVDVYGYNNYAFTFEFPDRVGPVELPPGEYTFDVRLEGADPNSPPVMRLGPLEVPGCVKAIAKATLVDGVPTFEVIRLRQLPS